MSAPRYFPLPLSTLKHTPHSGLQAFTPPLSHLEGHVLRAMAAARDPTLCPIWKAAGGRGREGMSRNKLDNLPPSSLRLRERGAECSNRSRPSYAAPQGEGFAHPPHADLLLCVCPPSRPPASSLGLTCSQEGLGGRGRTADPAPGAASLNHHAG